MNFKIKKLSTDDERAFIVKYWLDSYKATSRIARMIAPKVFYKWHKKLVLSSLDKWNTILVVDESDPDLMIGFMNYTETKDAFYVNFVLVKESFRGFGLGRKMFNHAMEGTALDKVLVLIHQGDLLGLSKGFKEVIFNPYIAPN